MSISNIEVHDGWRKPIIDYLIGLVEKLNRNLRLKSINYIMYSGILFKIGSDGMLLECLSKVVEVEAITQVHEGLCSAHQSGIKMRWLLRRHGVYWQTIQNDCIDYAKGCQECQKHSPLKYLPTVDLQYVVKP